MSVVKNKQCEWERRKSRVTSNGRWSWWPHTNLLFGKKTSKCFWFGEKNIWWCRALRRTLDKVNLKKAITHKTARFNLAEGREKKPDEVQNTLWSVKTKINLCGSDGFQHVWREPGQQHHRGVHETRMCECNVMGLHECQRCMDGQGNWILNGVFIQ